jgi:glutathione S-transferase
MSMDLREHHPGRRRSDAVLADISRITAIWRDAREKSGDRGPFLFGGFTIADAMYAPVVTRFDTYEVELDPVCRAYADTILALPAFLEWRTAAQEEPWVITRPANPAAGEA